MLSAASDDLARFDKAFALLGWKLLSDDGKQAVLDIGSQGSAIFKAAPPEQKAVLVDGFAFAIEPWNTRTIEAELRKRNLNRARRQGDSNACRFCR